MKVIYIGPNIPARSLQRFQVFSELPAAIVGEPALVRLFVAVEDLCRARAALSVEGSIEWIAYRDAVWAFFQTK